MCKTSPRPVPPRTGRRRNRLRRDGTLGNVNPEPLATGFGRHRAGVVDADIAVEVGHYREFLSHVPALMMRGRVAGVPEAAMIEVSEFVIMEQTGHRSVATLRLSIWLCELFRQNAAARLGIRFLYSQT